MSQRQTWPVSGFGGWRCQSSRGLPGDVLKHIHCTQQGWACRSFSLGPQCPCSLPVWQGACLLLTRSSSPAEKQCCGGSGGQACAVTSLMSHPCLGPYQRSWACIMAFGPGESLLCHRCGAVGPTWVCMNFSRGDNLPGPWAPCSSTWSEMRPGLSQ